MDHWAVIEEIKNKDGIRLLEVSELYPDEVLLFVDQKEFKPLCLALHKRLASPVMMMFADDTRDEGRGYDLYCVFMAAKYKKWFFVRTTIGSQEPRFDSLTKDIYSATFFEREIKEMFGIEPCGHPDARRMHLHNEVWPQGHYPLRKDFKRIGETLEPLEDYVFAKVEGEGVFEVPVGPVHAGIIGPGHFRFSAAGEPIINLEIRLGFTHRGVEKIFEKKGIQDAVGICERVSGDTSFAHSLAFCRAVEKINGIQASSRASFLRGIFLELERMYNHVNDLSGIALDVGFSFPSALASLIKESILQLNEQLTASRYLRGVNVVGGVSLDMDEKKQGVLKEALKLIESDFRRVVDILEASVSFMDRVDGAGVLKRKTAQDIGVVGLAARACGIPLDLRKDFPGVYGSVKFKTIVQEAGDVLARSRVRIHEFEESLALIRQFLDKLPAAETATADHKDVKDGFALGYAEGWRGPVLYAVKLDKAQAVARCKIVDASFHNWQGLAFSVLGDIIPDFPLCNKSFDLSYPGNDL